MQVILKDEIIQKLKEVGLKSGDTVMVHTSLGKMGYVCGGAQTVIEALMEVVGDSGTIMMPTQSWKNLDPETGVHWEAEQKDWQLIRDNWPAYDKNLTPTNTMRARNIRASIPVWNTAQCQKRGKESGKPTKHCLWMATILIKSERILRKSMRFPGFRLAMPLSG